jgi:hypothetical protein
MACRKAFDLDLVACLLDAGRPEWAEFRDHYPRCADCAAEVRTWTELQASLAAPHPAPDELLKFEQRSKDLAPAAHERIGAHVATCRSCRDELRALRAFDPRALEAAPAPAPAKRRWWRSLGGIVLHPAFAYGVALALLYPALAPYVDRLLASRWTVGEPGAPMAPRVAIDTTPRREPRADEGRRERGDAAPIPPPSQHEAVSEAFAPASAATAQAPADRAYGAGLVAKEAAVPTPEAAAPSIEEARVIVLTPNREIAVPRSERDLLLRLAPPRSQPAIPAGLAWLRVRDVAGRREIREQQFGSPGSSAELRVPADWLAPGSYRADLILGDDNRPLVVARFRIEP